MKTTMKLLVEVSRDTHGEESTVHAWLETNGEGGPIEVPLVITLPDAYAPSYIAEVAAKWIGESVNRGAKLHVAWNTLHQTIRAEVTGGSEFVQNELYSYLCTFHRQMEAATFTL